MKRCRLKRYNFKIKNKMNKKNKTSDKQQNGNDFIADVSNCATWKPTMCLRWHETDNYNAINDDFDKVLQQKWQSDKGEEKWEDIEIYGR